jgi:hypothetical protein
MDCALAGALKVPDQRAGIDVLNWKMPPWSVQRAHRGSWFRRGVLVVDHVHIHIRGQQLNHHRGARMTYAKRLRLDTTAAHLYLCCYPGYYWLIIPPWVMIAGCTSRAEVILNSLALIKSSRTLLIRDGCCVLQMHGLRVDWSPGLQKCALIRIVPNFAMSHGHIQPQAETQV